MEKKQNNKGYEKKLKKAGVAAISVSVLTAGTVGIVSAYQNGKDYTPSKNERGIQDNQVVFSDNEDTLGHKKDKKKAESELLKKDQNEDNGSKNEENPGYLFENSSMLLPGNSASVIASNGTGLTPVSGQTQNGTTYKLTGDASNADILISGGGKGSGLSPAENPTENDKNGGSDKKEDNKKDNNKTDNDNNGGNNDPVTPVNPTRPSKDVADPVGEKKIPTSNDYFKYNPFKDGIETMTDADETGDSRSVVITPKYAADGYMLYKGQSIDESIIYNALDTQVMGKDGVFYVWGTQSYGTYIRIKGVSFDGGTTWSESFPVTIPEDLEADQMKISVEYRLSTNTPNWVTRIVDYDPEETRLFVLNREVAEGEKNIDPETIINASTQYPDPDTLVNLLRLQSDYLGNERLTQLFPGWMEEGKLVSPFYKVTGGRHILEPAAMVPLDSSYVVQLKNVWMSDDYIVGNQYSNLCYLQTLTNMDTPWKASWTDDEWQVFSSYNVLDVPKYIQAIMIDENAGISTNYLSVPDTVLYIDTQNSGMRVNLGYIVDKDNLNYSSTDEGLLMNKAGTEILNIPYNKTTITIPDTVEKVQVEKNNRLKTITVNRKEDGTLPEISYANLNNCKIIMDEELVEEVLENNAECFSKKKGNTVASADAPETGYYIEEGMIIDTSGNLIKVIPSSNKRIKLTDEVKHVQETAFAEASNVTSVILPKNGNHVQFEKESLENSSVQTILCYKKQQYDSAKKQIEQYGLTDISVELLSKSKEGYEYSTEYVDGAERHVLIQAPADVTMFDGTVTAEDGSPVAVTEIGESAFADCENLAWAFLPESVDTIGSQAFKNCSSLQGIMIRNTEKITMGYGAIDGCSALRFMGSNAEHGEFLDGYDPQVTDGNKLQYFYVPTYSDGYGSGSIHFVDFAGVAGYDVISDGGDGWILYGLDDSGNPWLALRSGDTVADEVTLPDTTLEIYTYAFADTRPEHGDYYTVNFENTRAQYLDEGAFYNSGLGGDVKLKQNSWVGDYAFKECKQIRTMNVPGDGNVQLNNESFAGCSNLKTARIGKMSNEETKGTLNGGIFSECPNLTDIYLEDEIPAELTGVYSNGYRFNYDWSSEEECQNLRLHVPEGTEKEYVKAWRYDFAGYSGNYNESAYQIMWQEIQMDNIDWDTWEFPEDELVDEKLKEKLLIYENHLWTLLGESNMAEPVDFYPYRVDNRGYVTLIGAPSYVTDVDFYDTTFMGLPDGWFFDGIGTNAFAGTKGLRRVVIPYTMAEIHDNAFAGVESDSLTLQFDGFWPLDLILEDGKPFSFGVDDSVLHLEISEYFQDDFIQAWSYKLAGYDDLESMRTAVKAELTTSEKEPTDVEVDTEIAARLLPQVNRLRKMMGREEINQLDAAAFGLNVQEEEPENSDSEEAPAAEEQTIKEQNAENPTMDNTQKELDGKSPDQAENSDASNASGAETISGVQKDTGSDNQAEKAEKKEESVAVQTMAGNGEEKNE